MIGTNEILIVGVLLMFVVAPFALLAFLVIRKATSTTPNQAKEIADLREEVGRLREQIAGRNAAMQSEPGAAHGVMIPHDYASAQRVGQR